MPPYPWPELAIKAELRAMEERLDVKLERFENDLVAEIHRMATRTILTLVVAMVGGIFTAAALAFAAGWMA